MTPGRSVAYHTLGCKLNFSETSSIRRALNDVGYRTVDYSNSADIYVINTCSVTENANRKCRAAVRKAKKLNPDAQIAVIGCYAQLKSAEIESIPGVSLVLGAGEKFNVEDHLAKLELKPDYPTVHASRIRDVKTFQPSFSLGDRTRTFLKVQDGCDYFCSFCTIPLARGRSRSTPIANIVEQAKTIAKEGIKEVVLTGVNIGDYGRSSDGLQRTDENFLQLIEALDEVEGIERFRISSIEPNLLSDNIIDFVANSKRFMPHFHIPLQSGSDKMLKLMRRKYDTSLYRQRVERIFRTMPDASIGIDVICGFRGETEQDFLDTHAFYTLIKPGLSTRFHLFGTREHPWVNHNPSCKQGSTKREKPIPKNIE